MKKGIILNQVSFSYQKEKKILQDICLEVSQGDFLGIVGKNGSGKTTLSYLFNGLIPHFIKGILHGEIFVDGELTRTKSVAFFSKKIGMVFQNPDFSLFNLTVKEEIEFGLSNFGYKNNKSRIKNALAFVGLPDYLERDPQTLSFGEKQKISLASVIALDTPYIVLDEPSAMLDHSSSIEIYNHLKDLNISGKTIITIDHDTDMLWKYAKKTMILEKGKVVTYEETKKVLTNKKILENNGLKIPNYNL